MDRQIWKIAIAVVAAALALAALASAEEAEVTKCTALDICYCVNTKYLDAITANVSRVRQLIADNKAKGKAVGYLSVPLSPAGGGSYSVNSAAAQRTPSQVRKPLGLGSALTLNPGAQGLDTITRGRGA